MKKRGNKEEISCNSAEPLRSKRGRDTFPVYLALAVILLTATVVANPRKFLPYDTEPISPPTANRYVWLTGVPDMADGIYLYNPEQMETHVPGIGALLAEEAARGADPVVHAVHYDGDKPRLEQLPPALANIFLQPIPVNRAGKNILTSLPGIGPVLAEKIVQRRKRHGPFRSKDELMEIPGIGPRKFAGLVDHITLD